jgi:sterol desaturase/sphingolipid hydroxylase (fatty acid hydroxylase superfamily)
MATNALAGIALAPRPESVRSPGPRMGRHTLGAWAVVGVTTVLAAEGWRSLATAPGGPWHAMVSQGVVLIGPAVLALVVLALAAERLWPAVARPAGAVGHRQDALYLALYVAVAVPAVTLIGAGAATVLQRLDGGFTLHPFGALPRWALVVVVLVLIDLANWTSHLYNHRIAAFWRFHALHHSQEEMSILTSFRAHPLVHTSFQLTAVPLIVLGTGGAVPASVLIGYVLLSTMPHANVNWGFGPLRYMVVSPAYHRLHHDRDDRRGVNLGTVLVLWDVLAGLAVFPARRPAGAGSVAAAAPVSTGLAGRPLPVEQESGVGLARTMGRQLWSPIQGTAVADGLDGAGANRSRVRIPEMAGASHG